ncbi:MAG: calcium/proton exchanger [Armatimonadetes bacterium]|nr:calcium/proton exchanger [Armatimonadota bacterium]
MLRPSINWLIIFLPIAVILEVGHLNHAPWASPTLIFLASALAIIPIAGWMGHATEHLAARLGEGIGGLLNATFGNAAELIIAFMALLTAVREPEQRALMHGIVKASLTGSIIGNVLLVLGIALLAGGLRFQAQRFNPVGTRVNATLLTLAAIALLIPGLFSQVVSPLSPTVEALSLELSVVLLVVYALSLVFSLKTHRHLYVGDESAEEGAEHHEHWSVRRALGVLVLATVGVGVLAELMVGSVHAAAASLGWTDLFVGVVVVAIVGNAAEHSTAVLVAMRNRMDLALTIAIGSSIQIALFAAPLLVLVSYALGAPMDLNFTVAEIVAVGVAVITVEQIASDGESHWLEGVLLLTVYVMLGVLFFHLPATPESGASLPVHP